MSIRLEKKHVVDLEADLIVVEEDTLFSDNPPNRLVLQVTAPEWQGGTKRESEKLARRYRRGLNLAVRKNLRSVGFPLFSVASQGYPPEKAWRTALYTCIVWQEENPNHELEIIFAEPDDAILAMGQKEMAHQEKRTKERHNLRGFRELANALRSAFSSCPPAPPAEPAPNLLPRCPATEKAISRFYRTGMSDPNPIGYALLTDLENRCRLFVSLTPLVDRSTFPMVQTSRGPAAMLEEGKHYRFHLEDTSEGKCLLAYTSEDNLIELENSFPMEFLLEKFLTRACELDCEGVVFNYGEQGFFLTRRSVQNVLDVYHRASV